MKIKKHKGHKGHKIKTMNKISRIIYKKIALKKTIKRYINVINRTIDK